MKIFYLPDLGEGLAEAEIREWYVNEGDEVVVDQPLVSMETAKAVVDVPSPYAGKIKILHGKANDIIKTNAPLISYETNDETIPKAKNSVVGALEESSGQWQEESVIIGKPTTVTPVIKAMPAARVLANQLNVDLAGVKATGPNGLITAEDVKRSLQGSGHALTEGEGLHGVRRMMAITMAQSHREVVPATIIEDADISHLPAKTDITALLLMAMVKAAQAEPALNAWFDGKGMERKLFKEVNIGLAIDTPEGLFVPVVKQAETKSAEALRETVDAYKKAVKARNIPAADMQGATITLSNFGSISGRYATPVVVPPAVAILAVGKSRETAIVKEGKITAGKLMPLSLTFDHRAVTGGEASRYLAAVIACLEK